MTTVEILDALEVRYSPNGGGPQTATWPKEPYEFLVWWHCGYPASDAACERGWEALTRTVGVGPEKILASSDAKLAAALKVGGMVPELRAQRLREIAERVVREFGGDLTAALAGPVEQARKVLKKFPNIADAGTDRILLFAGLSPAAAVPSNCPQVLVRIQMGLERENYTVTYREAQKLIEAGVKPALEARQRAYLLLKRHGQELCKRTKPKCESCPVSGACRYFAGVDRGRKRPW
jgi:endonuclease III